MKRRLALVLVLCLILAGYAIAETKSFTFAVVPTGSVYEYQLGALAKKADSEQKYYVTTTSNGFSDKRAMYYISCTSEGQRISNSIKNSGNAAYTTTAAAGDHYLLAYRTARQSGDSDTLCAIVKGRWTP